MLGDIFFIGWPRRTKMFDFTPQERKVILFLAAVTLVGLGIDFAIKINPRLESRVKVDGAMTRIDINRVSLADLLGIPYIRPALAKKIIAYRNRHGEFKDLEELKEIKGIGNSRYEKLKGLFIVK